MCCPCALLGSCKSRQAVPALQHKHKSLCRRQAQKETLKPIETSELRQGAAMGGGTCSPCPAWLAVIALMATSSYSISDTL